MLKIGRRGLQTVAASTRAHTNTGSSNSGLSRDDQVSSVKVATATAIGRSSYPPGQAKNRMRWS
jgi:hypothetical protein